MRVLGVLAFLVLSWGQADQGGLQAPTTTHSDAAVSTGVTKPDPLSIELFASQRSFSSAEPVLLKVQVRNETSDVIAIRQVTPWHAVTLLLVKDGKTIEPLRPPAQQDWLFSADAILHPGDSYAYHWYDNGNPSHTFLDFNPITFWGYATLQPGHYQIMAAPLIVEGWRNGHSVYFSRNVRSNAVSIDVTPTPKQ